MFIGHYGVAFAAKRAVPGASLGTLFLAAQLVDLTWPVLLLVGVERVRIVESDNPFLRLAFEWYPWTHSLVTVLLWGCLFGALYALRRGDRRGGIVAGALVVSHWVLDWITHVPDLPVYPGGPLTGLGLWRSVPGTMLVEALIFVVGVGMYLTRTRPADRPGRYGLWGLVAFFAVIFVANAYSPPPPSANAVAWAALAAWLFPAVGWWVDRHRAVAET